MKILIGIVTKNRIDILPKAIESALSQRLKDKKVYVFDDNSFQDIEFLKNNYTEVEWIFSKEDKNYLYARNLLMRLDGYEFYCSLDDDAWFLEGDELEIALEQFEKDEKIAAIAFDILSPDKPNENIRTDPLETNLFIGCGHILKLSAVKEVGYYDENPGKYGGEEKELAIKLIDAGYKIIKLPGVHVWHDKSEISRDKLFQWRSSVCNDLVFAYRKTPFIALPFVLISKVLKNMIFSIKYDHEGYFKAFLNGIKDFILYLPSIKRKPVKLSTIRKFKELSK